MIQFNVHVVRIEYHQSLEDTKRNRFLIVLNILKCLYVIRMVRKTIHVTKEQAKWVEGNALNLSKYVRKLIDTDMAKWNEITEKVLRPIIDSEQELDESQYREIQNEHQQLDESDFKEIL